MGYYQGGGMRGDFYSGASRFVGDYYTGSRGDFWSKAKKRVIKGATKLLQYAAPAVAPVIAATPAGRVLAPVVKTVGAVAKSPVGRTVATGAGLTLGAMGIEAALSGAGAGGRKKKRQVIDLTALRRAASRLERFRGIANRVERNLPHRRGSRRAARAVPCCK